MSHLVVMMQNCCMGQDHSGNGSRLVIMHVFFRYLRSQLHSHWAEEAKIMFTIYI